MSERLSCGCDGFCEASEQEAGVHVTCRQADGSLERNCSQFYSASRGGAWRRMGARGDGPFFCSQPLIPLCWIVPTIAKFDKMRLKPARKDKETFS